jgi:hypothetical protein
VKLGQVRSAAIVVIAIFITALVAAFLYEFAEGEWQVRTSTFYAPEPYVLQDWQIERGASVYRVHRWCEWQDTRTTSAREDHQTDVVVRDFLVTLAPGCRGNIVSHPRHHSAAFKSNRVFAALRGCDWFDRTCRDAITQNANEIAIFKRFFFGHDSTAFLDVDDTCFTQTAQICVETKRATFFEWQWMYDGLHEKILLIVLAISVMVLILTFLPTQVYRLTIDRLARWIRDGG